jgi:XTP/dITP diphosphohydrolase
LPQDDAVKIRFISSNEYKIKEVTAILSPIGVEVVPAAIAFDEVQTNDVRKLVEDKLIKAFRAIGKPLFVEHTGLYINYLNGFPAGLTKVFWNNLQADKFAEIVGVLPDPTIIARTVLGYCDGRQFHFFEGEISGRVPKAPVGSRDCQWDCVFIPDGETQTFAELGVRKNEISMRRKALDRFAEFLKRALVK